MARWNVEVTDTFGGEANYCWVNRYEIDPASDKQADVVRAAKKAAGWTGMRCATESYGDQIKVTPTGKHRPLWVMFIDWAE